MNKNDLIANVAEASNLSKADAGAAVDAVLHTVTNALAGGGEVRLVGFGTFSTANRAATTGRNPRTGEVVPVPDRKVPVFKPSNEFKSMITKLSL